MGTSPRDRRHVLRNDRAFSLASGCKGQLVAARLKWPRLHAHKIHMHAFRTCKASMAAARGQSLTFCILYVIAGCCLPRRAQPAVLRRSAMCPNGALQAPCLQAQPAMPACSQSRQISTCCILVVERQLSRGLSQPDSRNAQLVLQKVLQFWVLLPFPDMPAATPSQA